MVVVILIVTFSPGYADFTHIWLDETTSIRERRKWLNNRKRIQTDTDSMSSVLRQKLYRTGGNDRLWIVPSSIGSRKHWCFFIFLSFRCQNVILFKVVNNCQSLFPVSYGLRSGHNSGDQLRGQVSQTVRVPNIHVRRTFITTTPGVGDTHIIIRWSGLARRSICPYF